MKDWSIEDVLLFEPRFLDQSLSSGLWWCATPEDVAAVKINAVCLAAGARWEDVQRCQDWIAGFQCLFVASPDRALVDQVRRHVTWMPVLSASPKAFRGYPSVTALVEGCGPAVLDRLMYGFQVEPSNGLVGLSQVTHTDLTDRPRTLSGLTLLDRRTGGFFAGGLSVWTGKRGEGKSSLLGQILLEAVEQDHRVCAYSGELTAAEFKDWVLCQAAGPDFLEERRDPDTGEPCWLVPAPVAALIDEWWDKRFYLYDVGAAASHDEDRILSEFAYAHRYLGCDVFLVDNIMTARLSGDRDYYRAQSLFTQRLVQFAKSAGAHVHLVAHPRKTDRTRPIEDSDDVSGTGDITNLADNVLSVRRLTEAEEAENGCQATLSVLKARRTGKRGQFALCFDPPSRRFYAPGGSPNKKYGWALSVQTQFQPLEETT